MKKQHGMLILGILAPVLLMGLIFYFWQKPVKQAQKQISNYSSYKYSDREIAKVKKNEKDFIYYYAADGKRYVFPDLNVFKSWFGDYNPDDLKLEDIETMSQSPLGGNVYLRPGSLFQSPTLLNTFIVVKNGNIRPVSDEKILTEFYGDNWQSLVVILPDYYFSQYVIGKVINSASDIPEISAQITIDRDKGFTK